MASIKKPAAMVLLLLAGLVAGFIFLLKGCLARYDERFARGPVLVFEHKGKTTVFSLVEFQKTTSYSRKGGMVRKSVNTSYFIQLNDGATAQLLQSRKVKKHRQVKYHPVEVMGAAGNNAWVFMGELMAFDAGTLETVADKLMLEDKNPALKDLLPDERRYYEYSRADGNIYITAKDGSKWMLNGVSLQAEPADGKAVLKPGESSIQALEAALKENDKASDSLYQQKNYRPSTDYSTRKISMAEYQRVTKHYYAERDSLRKIRDSLYKLKQAAESMKRNAADIESEMENLERLSPSFSQIKANYDTGAGKWLGLYGDKEWEDLPARLHSRRLYDETARRMLISAPYSIDKYGNLAIDKDKGQPAPDTRFLDGGFLLNKKTAAPLVVNNMLLVVHKSQVGRAGKIMISAMSRDGKRNWSYTTPLSEWADWQLSANKLIIAGTNNKELSSAEINLLICLDVQTGKATLYDYFKNKVVTE